MMPVAIVAAWAPSGCARVSPQSDYQKTAALVADRTGSDEAYDPDADAIIDEKVAALTAEGVTVDEAARIALLRNRGFQSLFAKIGASRADVVQSGLLSNPSFGFMARFPEGGGRSDLTFSFAQEIVDLWQIPVRKSVAEAQLQQTVFEAGQRGIDLVADAKSKAFQLLALQRAEQINRENVELVDRSLKLAQDRYAAGEAGQIDVNLVRATLLEVRLNLIAVQRDLQIARAALAAVMGLARWPDPWELKDSLEIEPVAVAGDQELLIQAMRQRLDAQAAGMAVRQAEGQLRRQYLSIFSSIQLGSEAERFESRALPGRKVLADTVRDSVRNGQLTAPDIESRGQRDIEKRQIIDSVFGPTLSITVPIWDQNQAQIAKAAFQVTQKQKELEDLLDTVARQVREAAAATRTAEELVKFYREQTLPQGRENVAAAQRAYQAGEQNIVALIDAQRFLISQRLANVNVLRDYATALAELHRVVGGMLPTATSPPAPASQPAD
jgi:cobalt-zinc-cadmium efflux system outer membrane protein